MFRRHFFLAFAVLLIVVMAGAATYKLTIGKKPSAGPGGAPGATAAGGGRGGPPGGPSAAGGRGGRGGGALVAGVPVVQRPFTDRVEVLGVAKGRESVTLTSNQAEMVTAVRFRPGQRVTRGQVLLDLKADEEDAQIMQATAVVNQAKTDADRWATLADRGVAPRATAEQYRSAYQTAQANLRAAQARRNDRVIRAPFSGTVGLSDIAPGALISPGTAIATLDDTSVMHVDFDVPDRFLPVVREGMPVEARSDSYPDLVQGGVIARIDTRVDERTRAVKARAEFKNPGGKLKPGMLMRVGIERGSRMSLAAPEAAVQFSGDQSFVFVINPRTAGPGTIGGGQAGARQGAPAAGAQSGAPMPGAAASVGRGAPGAGPGGPGGQRGVGAPPCAVLTSGGGGRRGPGQSGAGGAAGGGGPQGPATNSPTGGQATGGGPGAPGGGRGPGGRPGQVEQRPVLAGLIEGGFVELREGVRLGEIVVADGLNKVQTGQPVNWCAGQLPQAAAAAGGRGAAGMGRGGAPGAGGDAAPAGAGGRGAGAGGRPGGQSSGGFRQGRPGGGRVAGAAN